MKILKWVFFVLGQCLLLGFVHGQTPRFYLQADRTNIAEGETFVLEAVLENIDSKTIEIPDLAPFKVVQGPSTSTSISIVNGKKSGFISYQYILLATQKGKFTIPSATTKVGSKVIKSNVLPITVTSGAAAASSAKIDAKSETFVRLEVGDTKAYLGQQIALNYVLYTRQNIESYNIVNEPDLEGFYAQPINNIRDQPKRRSINGKEYYTQVIRRQILFPQKTGTYNIGPVNISLDIPVENGRSSFFFRETKKENTTTNALKLTVKDLPKAPPISFSGGVGSYEMKASVANTSVKTGEAITLRLQIDGDGDPKIVKAPNFKIPNGLEKYEPTTIQDETIVAGDKIMVQKVFEYIFVPSKDTIYSLEPEFSFLSSESGQYETIKAGPFNINVTVGSGQTYTANNDQGIEDIDQLISKDNRLYSLTQSPWASTWHVSSLIGLCLLTFIGIFIKKRKLENDVLAQLHNAKAGSIAKQKLQSAFGYKNENNPKAFYEEIAQATTGYILKKYNIPNTESSLVQVISHLHHHQVQQAVISKYQQIQKKCELARFAGQYDDVSSVYDDAEWMINEMEKAESGT